MIDRRTLIGGLVALPSVAGAQTIRGRAPGFRAGLRFLNTSSPSLPDISVDPANANTYSLTNSNRTYASATNSGFARSLTTHAPSSGKYWIQARVDVGNNIGLGIHVEGGSSALGDANNPIAIFNSTDESAIYLFYNSGGGQITPSTASGFTLPDGQAAIEVDTSTGNFTIYHRSAKYTQLVYSNSGNTIRAIFQINSGVTNTLVQSTVKPAGTNYW